MAKHRELAASALSLLLLLLPACAVIPTKMPTKVRGGSGAQLQKHAINPEHIRLQLSTREQVKQEFAAIDTGCEHPRLFWGRWVSSSFGVIAGAMWGFGPGEQSDGSARLWHKFDLLVVFDADGIARSKTILQDDDAALWHALRRLSTQLSLPVPSETIASEPAEYESSQAFFSPSGVHFSAGRKQSEVAIQYSPDTRIEIRSDFQSKNTERPNLRCYVGKFSDPRTGTRLKNHFCVDSTQLLTLIQYLDNSGSQILIKK